jgi:uncharacterized membrane protein YedE/YeeE
VRVALALVAGVLFGLGLLISGMATPAKVTAFLDVTGAWDPSLAFVMAAAIAVHAPFVRLARRRSTPLFEPTFHWPSMRGVDPTLIAGAAIFGVGWGIAGYCPGPVLVSLGTGSVHVLVFFGAMLAALFATRAIVAKR